jgi:Rrf2 family protein
MIMQLLIQSGDLGPKWFHVALRSLAIIATEDKFMKSNEIASRLEEDATYIRKILVGLAKHDIIRTHGGRYGGYSMSKLPESITVKDVYKALSNEQINPYWSVPSTGTEQYISLIIAKAEEVFQKYLNEFTLADILRNQSKVL